MIEIIFWSSIALIVYSYFGYPILLFLCQVFKKKDISKGEFYPDVDIIIPAYNEERIIGTKIRNTLSMDYPSEKRKIYIISDASSDETDSIIKSYVNDDVHFIRQNERQGKAAALNKGLSVSNGEIVVFTDASILLTRSALANILRPFKDPDVGCVSGEDQIPEGGGEGAYGRYELMLRNLESRCYSIVGASGCFYAQRRKLTTPFTEGRAPDFLSVLETVKSGFLAITEQNAVGLMGKVNSSEDEFKRKLRTIIRGITTLMDYKGLLNPMRYGFFAIELFSHKILRWFVGILLVLAFFFNLFMLNSFYGILMLVLQILFYTLAIKGWQNEKHGDVMQRPLYKIPLFFCISNLAATSAMFKYAKGVRQEIWESSKR